MASSALALHQFAAPRTVTSRLRRDLIACWVEVTNAGGAAGFPFPPIDADDAAPAVDKILSHLAPETSRLLTAECDGRLAGWLHLRSKERALTGHWGTVRHVQTLPDFRGRGIGAALMESARTIAAREMGLEQLHLEARSGAGLEEYYTRLGWRETGRRPGALRVGPDDDRDEVLMALSPLLKPGEHAGTDNIGGIGG